MAMTDGARLVACDVCGRKTLPENMKSHKEAFHAEDSTDLTREPLLCPQCGEALEPSLTLGSGFKHHECKPVTRERELRERAREQACKLLFGAHWEIIYATPISELSREAQWDIENYTGGLLAFAQDEIASLERKVELLQLEVNCKAEFGRLAEERAERLEAKLASARQEEREQCSKDICSLCRTDGMPKRSDKYPLWTHEVPGNVWYWGNCMAATIHERAQAEGKVSK